LEPVEPTIKKLSTTSGFPKSLSFGYLKFSSRSPFAVLFPEDVTSSTFLLSAYLIASK